MMAKLRITSRGKAAGLIGASVIALGAATGDALMCAAGALVPLAMAADFVGVKARERGVARSVVRMSADAGAWEGGGGGEGEDEVAFEFEREGEREVEGAYEGLDAAAEGTSSSTGRGVAREARIIAGERFSSSGVLAAKCRISALRANAPFSASFAEALAEGGADANHQGYYYEVRVEAQPRVFGRYSAGHEGLEATVPSPAGFYSSYVPVGLDPALRVIAFPRFYPGLVRALGLLEGGLAGDAEESEGARGLRVSRVGGEYAWTREYAPGDPDRFIDWKATARRARLCVKEFREERGGGALVFFDGRAPGAVSADEMARDLLSVCAGLAEEGRGACFVSAGVGHGDGRGEDEGVREAGSGSGAREGAVAGAGDAAVANEAEAAGAASRAGAEWSAGAEAEAEAEAKAVDGEAGVVEGAGPAELLRIAIARALRMTSPAGQWEGGAYALMPPKVRSAVMEIIGKGAGKGKGKMKGSGGAAAGDGEGASAGAGAGAGAVADAEEAAGAKAGARGCDAYEEALRRVRGSPVSLAYVGCPLYEPVRALALVDAAGDSGGAVAALMPGRPWLDARTLGEAYEMRESYLRVAGRVEGAAARGGAGGGYGAWTGYGGLWRGDGMARGGLWLAGKGDAGAAKGVYQDTNSNANSVARGAGTA